MRQDDKFSCKVHYHREEQENGEKLGTRSCHCETNLLARLLLLHPEVAALPSQFQEQIIEVAPFPVKSIKEW